MWVYVGIGKCCLIRRIEDVIGRGWGWSYHNRLTHNFNRIPGRWFLFCANYVLFARGFFTIEHEYLSPPLQDVVEKAMAYHQFISFCLYIAGK